VTPASSKRSVEPHLFECLPGVLGLPVKRVEEGQRSCRPFGRPCNNVHHGAHADATLVDGDEMVSGLLFSIGADSPSAAAASGAAAAAGEGAGAGR
jgi:hypothetical protein